MMATSEVWQEAHVPGTLAPGVQADGATFAAGLPDGRQVVLPIRVLPGGTDRAVASLILNQASFAVLDALADAVAAGLRVHAPDLIAGVPTLGLPLAEGAARRLGHRRLVPLGTSRKFWYDEALSEPLRSITSPGGGKRLYLDPRLLPLLVGARVAVVDDVLSTGASLAAVLALLARAGVRPIAVGAAMLQGEGWRGAAGDLPVVAALRTPRLVLAPEGWRPEEAA